MRSLGRLTEDYDRTFNPREEAPLCRRSRSGARVVVTMQGHPFIELIPAQATSGMDFGRAETVHGELGLDGP